MCFGEHYFNDVFYLAGVMAGVGVTYMLVVAVVAGLIALGSK